MDNARRLPRRRGHHEVRQARTAGARADGAGEPVRHRVGRHPPAAHRLRLLRQRLRRGGEAGPPRPAHHDGAGPGRQARHRRRDGVRLGRHGVPPRLPRGRRRLSDARPGVERVSMLDTLTATTYFAYGSDYTYEGGTGCSFPGLYATMARAYFSKYGATERDLANVAIKNHENATHNPVAHLQKKITMEDVMGSMKVADPLKLYDTCPFSDGAAAAILCSPEVAKELTDTRIVVEASERAGSIADDAGVGE